MGDRSDVDLDRWQGVVHAPIPVPPRTPWTCLVRLLGAQCRLWADDSGYNELIDVEFAGALVACFGRPVQAAESLQLLLCTPLPVQIDLSAALGDVLASDSYTARQRAALVIGKLRLRACVPALVDALADDDDDVRCAVWQALGRIDSPQSRRAVIEWPTWDLHDHVVGARLDAVSRLGLWSRADALPDGSGHRAGGWVERLEAAHMGDVVALADLLSDDAVDVRRTAVRVVLERQDGAEPLAEALTQALVSEADDPVRDLLIEAMGRTGAEGADLLSELLARPDLELGVVCSEALAEIGAEGAVAESALRECVQDGDPDVAAAAVLALHRIGVDVADLEPRLWRFGAQSDHRRARLAEGLRSMAPLRAIFGLQEPGPALAAFLVRNSPSDVLREVGCYVLALHQADLAAPLLDRLVIDTEMPLSMELRTAASAGLMLAGGAPSRLGVLHRILLCHVGLTDSWPTGSVEDLRSDELITVAHTDHEWSVRLAALRLLGQQGPETIARFDGSLRHIRVVDSDADVRAQAAVLLGLEWMQLSPADLLSRLLISGTAESDQVHAWLRQLIRQSPAHARIACGHLLMDRSHRSCCREAARFIGTNVAGDQVQHVVSSTLARLGSSDWTLQEDAAILLGCVPTAVWPDHLLAEVVEQLRERLADEQDDDVRRAMLAAWSRLGKERT